MHNTHCNVDILYLTFLYTIFLTLDWNARITFITISLYFGLIFFQYMSQCNLQYFMKKKNQLDCRYFLKYDSLLLWLDKAISANFEMNLIIHHKLWFTITSQINHKNLLFSLFSIVFFCLLRFSFSCINVLFFNHEPAIMLNFCTALN